MQPGALIDEWANAIREHDLHEARAALRAIESDCPAGIARAIAFQHNAVEKMFLCLESADTAGAAEHLNAVSERIRGHLRGIIDRAAQRRATANGNGVAVNGAGVHVEKKRPARTNGKAATNGTRVPHAPRLPPLPLPREELRNLLVSLQQRRRRRVLAALLQEAPQPVSREEILRAAWGEPIGTPKRITALTQVISRIREVLHGRSIPATIVAYPDRSYAIIPQEALRGQTFEMDEELGESLHRNQLLVFQCLWQQRNATATYKDLCHALWHDAIVTLDRKQSIIQAICRLRKRLADAGMDRWCRIASLEGVGYMLTLEGNDAG